MVQLWQQTLDEIGEARFDEAFRLALNASVYRPDIAEIRRFAGLVTAAPLEQEAKAELTKLICLMRHHGWKLTNRGKPEKEPPVLSDIVAGTICDIGDGDKMEGFKVVWRHPALDLTRPGVELDELESFRAVAGEKIERKWVEFYTRRKAEGFKRHHEFPAVSA
jgi:hypothetical protein